MEQINECFKCIELKKSLQVEKKKVSQKNRLITLLRELVRSYEAKDLNLTITDLSRIYESSSSEVTILKQRLNLYLNENQELIQLKNEISSRNDLLEKKYREVEDEISHLRFVNKQLGDYYREKEADHDHSKDRLKKLARKLLCYEPKNSEVRKILNLQHTPIDLEPKSAKNGNKKKNEDNLKDMKKDNVKDNDLITMKSNPSDILNPDELEDMSDNSDCENDTDCNETNNFLGIEEGSNSQSPEPVLDVSNVNSMPDSFITSQPFDDKSSSEKSCQIISNNGDDIITCEESNSSSNCVDSIDHCSFYKNVSKDASSIEEVHENNSKCSEVVPSMLEEDSSTYDDRSEQNDIDANHKDSNNFLEFEGSLPDLISPLKSDEPRVLDYLDHNQTLQHDGVIQVNSDHVNSNLEVTENGVNNRIEKESSDIKNECSSNSGDQTDKKKSPHSTLKSKYQTLNDSLLFTEKPINGSHIPLNGNYASNYQFQNSHCFGCCNNSCDARPPVTLKLYNCSNVEISIPPVMQKQNLPIITVRDKCNVDKCCVDTSGDVNELADPSAIHCSFVRDKRNTQCNDGSINKNTATVLTCSGPSISRSNDYRTENMKKISNPYFQSGRDQPKNHDYYFSDYLSKNKVSERNCTFRKQYFNESESDTIKCNRLFPIRADKQFDLEHFCYRFGSLSLKYSFPEQSCKARTSDKMNSTNIYSSLFNISQPPVFHNSLKSSQNSNNKNEWVFGQTFLNGTTRQDTCHKTVIKPNNLLNKGTEENSINKIKHFNILQKSVLELKTDCLNRKNINDTIKNKNSARESVQNPFKRIQEISEVIGIKDCLKPVCFEVNASKTFFQKEKSFESRQMVLAQPCIKPPVENNQVSNAEINHGPFRNNSAKLQPSQWNQTNPSIVTRTSKSESVLSSNDKGCSKSIFDLDQRKNVSTGNFVNICNNKTKDAAAADVSSQKEAKLDQIQKPLALINSDCIREEEAEVQSKSQAEQCPKETFLKERPLLLKETSPKKIKHSQVPQSKNVSLNNEHLFKKPDSVNIRGTSATKISENKFGSKPLINKEVKVALNEKSKCDSPKKIDHLSKLIKKDSSPDDKRNSSKKMFTLHNGLHEEPKFLSGGFLKQGSKRVIVAHKKSININHSLVTDEEEDSELQRIFKEMEHCIVPLLSPLTKTPEIPEKETSGLNEVNESEGNAEENSDLEDSYKTTKSKVPMEVEDENITSSLEKPILNKERHSKADTINSRLEDNETIYEPKQSFSSLDESKYQIFSDKDEIESLEKETNIHTENHDEVLVKTEMEICTKTEIKPVNDKILENAEIESFTNTEEIKSYSRKRKKPLDDLNEAENYAHFPSLSEYKSKMSEESSPKTDYNPSIDVGPTSASDNKLELCSSILTDNKPSIGLGFYVNRTEEQSTSNVSLPFDSDIPKIECSTICNDLNPDISNAATEDKSSPDFCNADESSEMHTEELQEENVVPHEKEESSRNKRKLQENNDHVEGMCSKKQKIFSDDEYISCESDVFICALRYLSAAAVASSDGKVCTVSKTDSDLPTKIAINHIKNIIIETLQSIDSKDYNILNCSVKKIRKINDATPTSLAKAILELIVESNDKSEAKDKPYMPNMTKTVKTCLLIAVSFVGYNRDFVMKFCEVFEQYISSFYDKTLTVAEGSQLVIFYTSFCRSYNLDDKVRYLIYDVLYTRNLKAYPMVYKTIQTWPDIVPHSDTCFAKDCLLTQTIIFILLSGASSVDDKGNKYFINTMRNYLAKYFGYKCNFTRREELTDKLIENIAVKGGSVALVLLCKCEPWEWSLNLVEKKLLPILQSSRPMEMDETIICEFILTVGRVVRGFPITKAPHIVMHTLEIFERMLLESNSTHISEIIIEAISLLRRHNLMKCTSILMKWKPNTKEVTKKTINHISGILRVKNIGYWKNVYSAHSSNIIHNTRTLKKKRKSGFLNPP
ncbi:reticulocyte-binding protein homolog 1 isoform X2 [Halyomorpha halys]|uniref:reticulocyte-binding protein homolog 1 isoform X2 n=1 Tax=Halyomorpha halys TaxID=286706 RepID=UPI000D0C8036|nr:uncharacterized protein LOC106680916 isoform X2 [Halyomorpha halys]